MASFPYAAGVIRSLETKLLDKTDIERMVDAPDLENAFKVFSDTDYADNLADVQPHEFKKALDQDWQQAKDELMFLIGDENLLAFLFVKNDFRNIKLLFKQKINQNSEDLKNNLKSFGLTNTDNLCKYIIDEDKSVSIPDSVKKIVDQAFEDLKDKDDDPYMIDSYFDEVYFKIMREHVDKINNKFISELFRIQHKTNTLKFFIRAKRLNKSLEETKDQLPSRYHSLYDQSTEEVLKKLYWPIEMKPAIDNYLSEPDLWRLEKDLEEAEVNYIKKAKLISYGPELVVTYYFAKRNAIRNVRLIMTGKLNNVQPEKIKERVRIIY